jgi:AcrR family transcriptional regulator
MTEGYDNGVTTTELSSEAAPAGRAADRRRRGPELEDAILGAAFAELVEVGYTAFSVEGVAARAGTGKASIYRRWPSKQHLVMDTLAAELPSPEQCGMIVDPADLGDMTTADALHLVAENIARVICSPAGDAIRAIKCEAMADPSLAELVDARFQAPRRAALLGLLRRGVARGEVRPEALSPLVVDVIPAVLSYRVVMLREQLTARDITDIVDQIVLPLIEVRS